MSFFPPRRDLEQSSDVDPGWSAYIREPAPEVEDVPVPVATDLVVAETDRVLLRIPSVDVYENRVAFEVRSDLHEIQDGVALADFLDAQMAEGAEDKTASPPSSALLVGIELGDGTRLHTYPTGQVRQQQLRLESLEGGASGERGTSAKLRQTFVVRGGVPVGPFRIVCSFEAVGISDASVTVEARAA